jgi:hypothetical protein
MKIRIFAAALLLLSCFVFGQTTATGTLEGTVTDASGAVVPAAPVKVLNTATGQNFETTSNDHGYWVIASMPTAVYRVTINQAGFKAVTVNDVKVDAATPAKVNIVLQVGAVTEMVEVSSGAEVLQTSTATITSTLVGKQLHDLPFTSRNLSELIVTQPGSATPGVPRSTSVYGLPQSALNVTMDGINIQDNSNRSSDGFFNAIFPRADLIEEMTLTSAASGADSNSDGAMQMKMVTRSGSNTWHGLLFEQHRNQDLNANYYYNNILSLPRDHMVFNQFGGSLGGPIKKNKLFFFVYMEALQLPQTYTEPTGLIFNPSALAGNFTYKDTSGVVRTTNLLTLAGSKGFSSTVDPLVGKTLGQIASLTNGFVGVTSRIASSNDYNRSNLDFQSKGGNYRRFPSARLDWNATSKHHVELVYNYQTNLRSPDGVNITTASPSFPGTGNVLGGTVPGNQGGIAFLAVAALRSTLTSHLTSEIRFGLQGGTVIFNNGIGASDFAQWNGYAPLFGASCTAATNVVECPYRVTGQSRRNTPLKQGNLNMTWSKSAHLLSWGGSFTQVNSWTTSSSGTQLIPTVTLGTLVSGDPVANVFTTANMPGLSSTDQTNADNIYALLTGRVAAVNRSVVSDEGLTTYGNLQPIVKNQQRELSLFVQDSWHVKSNLTVNFGLRWDDQRPPLNLDGVYTRPGYAGLWGISGVGNLFSPGTLTGSAPVFSSVVPGTPAFSANTLYSPSIGLAYVVPKTDFKPLAFLFGKDGQTVIRAGYSISSIREDASTFAVWGTNQGRTLTLNVDPANFPANFGPIGSVSFSQATLPSRPVPATPTFPLATANGNSVADFDPNLHVGYVQSWDFGIQRQLTKDTVLEVRYVGNHGTGLWRQINLNEVNIFENGFLSEFKIAQANLALARATTPTSNTYAGLAGQQPLPIISTAVGSNSDASTATLISQGQAGNLANAIATNATRMTNLTKAGRPANFFQVNPLAGGNALDEINATKSFYDGLQVELRRRMSHGLLVQGSYVWSHSITNDTTAGINGTFTTLRNYALDMGPSPYDIRQAVKMNWIYELPFGPGRHFLGNVQNPLARRVLGGWELASVTRVQSGSPIRLTSGRMTYDQNDSGVVLHNITVSQLQSDMQINKTTNSQGQGAVFYLPTSLINNSLLAFGNAPITPGFTFDASQPYIGPPTTPGQLGDRVFLYGPWQEKWDFSLVKKTSIGEKMNLELRMQVLNAFNLTNFLLFVPTSGLTTTLGANTTTFGQLLSNSAYRDLSNTNDPGGRIIEFSLRFTF